MLEVPRTAGRKVQHRCHSGSRRRKWGWDFKGREGNSQGEKRSTSGKETFAGPTRDNVPGWTLIKWPCLAPAGPPGLGQVALDLPAPDRPPIWSLLALRGGWRFFLRLGGLPAVDPTPLSPAVFVVVTVATVRTASCMQRSQCPVGFPSFL